LAASQHRFNHHIRSYNMKHLIALLLVAFTSTAFAEAEVKEVCRDKTDAKGAIVKGKDGKPVQVCKKIKVHKKHEGTKVPAK
jgi:hypothetical protein